MFQVELLIDGQGWVLQDAEPPTTALKALQLAWLADSQGLPARVIPAK